MFSKIIPYRNTFYNIITFFLPIKKDRCFFLAYHGQYSDSPKEISEEIHKKYPNLEIWWEISDKSKEIIPKYIRQVKPNTFLCAVIRNSSKIIVDNYMGWNYGYTKKKNIKYRLLAHKRKGQFNLSTWHGTPLKKIASDEPGFPYKNFMFYSSSDILLCNNNFLSNVFKNITCDHLKIEMTALPRNDRLLSSDNIVIRQTKIKLKLPVNKRIILFAPTFRVRDPEMSGFYQIKKLNIKRVLDLLTKTFGGEWIFVFRVHDSIIKRIESSDKKNIDNTKVFSGNIGDDMTDYLLISDVLLTDYSSSMFDFIITKRPCFLYCPDYKSYEKKERGFYFKLDKLPYSIAKNEIDLYHNIERYSSSDYSKKVNEFIKEIGLIINDNGTRNAISIIENQFS